MNSILMQQQHSFEHKMNNIHTTNSILDDLQQKMQSYFSRYAIVHSKITEQPQSRFQTTQNDKFKSDNLQFIRKKPLSNYLNNQNRYQMNGDKNLVQNNQEQRLQFKLYNDYDPKKSQPKQQFQRFNKKINPTQYNQSEGENLKKQKQRMSQTSIYKNNLVHDNTINQVRGSISVTKNRKSQQFRLLGKSRGAREKQIVNEPIMQRPNEEINKYNHKNMFYDNSEQYLREENSQKKRSQKKINKNMEESNIYRQTNNSFLHSMQTIQIVMKEALDAKLRKIKQIQHQIMTENEQRVYLYKINVRLNQQLKQLQQEQKSAQIETSKNLQWKIKTLQDDVERLKKEITKKSNERKQLRKQQQTLKDGYQTVLNNKRNILRKDIQNYMNKQNQTKQNTEMLKGLMKQLDKLKGVVEAKIKNSSLTEVSKRKVIKSFKN